MFKSIFLPLIAVACFIVVVGLLSQGKLDPILKNISPVTKEIQKTIKINDLELKVEVAKTNNERSKGLSNRDKLDKDSGMIFVFPNNSKPVFWMKDTLIPLDIIWINDNRIIGIEKNVQPEPNIKDAKLKKYPAPAEVNYVLEANGGFCDNNNISIGDNVDLSNIN